MRGMTAKATLCFGLSGLARTAIIEAPGTSSWRISRRFARKSSGTMVERPVTLPPGRDRLCVRPSRRGSATATNTIGIVALADFNATAAFGPAAMSTSGLRAIRSATEAASRSAG